MRIFAKVLARELRCTASAEKRVRSTFLAAQTLRAS